MCNLIERMEHLSTREELQGVHNDIAINAQNISQLRLSHENLVTHIYRHFPLVNLGISILSTLLGLGSLATGHILECLVQLIQTCPRYRCGPSVSLGTVPSGLCFIQRYRVR